MSANTSTTEASERAYGWSETEWYDHAENRDRHDDAPDADHGPHHEEYEGTDRLAWVAHRILKRSARLVCATTLLDPPDRGWTPHAAAEGLEHTPGHDPTAMHHDRSEAELTAPQVPLGKTTGEGWGTTEYGYTGHDHRIQPEAGYLSGGESTGVIIADRPLEEFMAVVDLVLAARPSLRPQQAQEIEAWARQQKRSDDHDSEILQGVLARIEAAERRDD